MIPRWNLPQRKLLKYRQECTRHGQKGKSQKKQICTLNGRHGKCRRSINLGKYNNLGHLEWKLLKYWQEHAKHRQPQMLEKENSYLYLWTILLQFDLKIKPSSKEATEVPTRTYSTLMNKKYWKEKICTLKMIMFPKWNGEGTLQLLYARHRNCRLDINFGS